tara:strand:+ start:1411 stop:1656 length:246 start_codon:yes stop_codon:yes gene_type:complete
MVSGALYRVLRTRDGKPATKKGHAVLVWTPAYLRGKPMGKGNNQRSNKEAKKPKQKKPKPLATANSNAGQKPFTASGKKQK